MLFNLKSDWSPAGDQPQAIAKLTKGINAGLKKQTLLGVTGSGKTFTVAGVIQNVQRPTLVIAHNKTLAAQLAQEFRQFFPENSVEYFVSYYDYYQPEAYMPHSDTYIEKEAQVNDEIDRLRHRATQAILSRRDVIIVASVSCIYNLGSPSEYKKQVLHLRVGDCVERAQLIRDLVGKHYERTNADVKRGSFRLRGDILEIIPVSEKEMMLRVVLVDKEIKEIFALDPISRKIQERLLDAWVFPAKHYMAPDGSSVSAIKMIERELKDRLSELEGDGKLLEAQRLRQRTRYDMQMIKNLGYCNGIENYSRHFDGRAPGEAPASLLEYFPDDFLTIIDESHVTVPQIRGMFAGDQARKRTLIEHGFRLPSAIDNRPLNFSEFEHRTSQTVYVSATPGEYELEKSEAIVEQIVRPTGLVDPQVIIRPIMGSQVPDVTQRIKDRIAKNERTLVTTLTKKMAEDLTAYLQEKGIKVQYLHSDVQTFERIETLTKLRSGEYDVVIGVNLLREGLDLPEVSLVAILDADKEGFLRSETSLVQTIGRAARNVNGEVVLYADVMTGSIKRALKETDRRRKIQIAYNKKHNITPKSIQKSIGDIREFISEAGVDIKDVLKIEMTAQPHELEEVIQEKREEMKKAAKAELFETAALLRDEIEELENELKQKDSK